MPYQLTNSSPIITVHVQEFERQIANFCNTAGITTQAQLTAAIAGLTAAQQTTAVKALLNSITIR